MLEQFNHGRSRSFYYVAATLLPLEALKKSLDLTKGETKEKGVKKKDLKNKSKILKENLNETHQKNKLT